MSSKSDSILIPNMLCGGVGEDQIATEGHEIHEVCNAVRKIKVVRNKRSRYSIFKLNAEY